MKRFIEVKGRKNTLFRPNKTAAGMTKTIERQGTNRIKKPEVLRLAVVGTLDTLGRVLNNWRKLEKVKCTCSPTCRGFYEAYRLTDYGRSKLKFKKW